MSSLINKKNYTNARIAFVHGRPGPHPTHTVLAKAVGADFFFIDRILRYHDIENVGRIKKYTSSILNSILFKNAKQYDIILSEGMHLPPVIMKKLRILRPNQKIAGLMGNEFLFFLQTKWFPPTTQKLLLYMLCQYDFILCMSDFQVELAEKVLSGQKNAPKIIPAHEIISGERPRLAPSDTSNLQEHRLLFVAHGPSGWRGYYKGIETLLETFKLISYKYKDVKLTVVGEWDREYIDNLLAKTDTNRENIHFVGRQKDLLPFFKNADLCVHITNGDAFPIATLEAVRAGLPTIVSEFTGTKEVVVQVDKHFVVPMNPAAVSESIEWYFDLPLAEKKKLSDKGLEVMTQYSEEKGIQEFRNAIDKILNN